jgi:hypothetical protein
MKAILIKSELIAPCGMNCALCLGYQREKNRCFGCRGDDANKPTYCVSCRIKNCAHFYNQKSKYCFSCDVFPCKRLKQLDKRYRTKYHMSMIENLQRIKEVGIRKFIRHEKERWQCQKCGSSICVHRLECPACGNKWHVN